MFSSVREQVREMERTEALRLAVRAIDGAFNEVTIARTRAREAGIEDEVFGGFKVSLDLSDILTDLSRLLREAEARLETERIDRKEER